MSESENRGMFSPSWPLVFLIVAILVVLLIAFGPLAIAIST